MMGHNESIYNMIPPTYHAQPKPPMHRSSHSGTLHPTASTFHQTGTTHPAISNIEGTIDGKVVPDKASRIMGKPKGDYKNDATNHMKKYSKSFSVPSLAEVKQTNPQQLRPTHLAPRLKAGAFKPATDTPPVCNLVSNKNFIVANAVETILAQPKKVTQGAKDYLNKEDYGKTPKYLNNIKKDIEAEYDYIRQLHEQHEAAATAGVRPLDDEERLQLIAGLKAKWEAVNTDYQGQTHLTRLDTMGKQFRKEKNEAQMAQIEKDIEKLNKRGIQIHMDS